MIESREESVVKESRCPSGRYLWLCCAATSKVFVYIEKREGQAWLIILTMPVDERDEREKVGP